MSMRQSDRVVRSEIPRRRRTLDLTGWIGVRNPPAVEPAWRREPLSPSRWGAGDRVVVWVGERRTPLVAGALSVALVGVLVGSSLNSPVAAEALQPSPGASIRQAAQPPRATPAVMSKPATSPARFAVAADLPQDGQGVVGVSAGVPMALAANAVPAAGSATLSRSSSPSSASSLSSASSPSGASSLSGAGEASPASASPAAGPAAEPSASPAPSPSPARPVVPVPAIPVVPLTAAEQTAANAAAAAALTAADALAAANLTEANALAAAILTAANAKAAADLTAANAAAAAAATAQAAADAAWAVAHP